MQTDIGVGESQVGHGEIRIEAQRLMERAYRLNPDVGVEVGETLIIELLRLGGRGGDRFVHCANSLPQRNGSIKNFARDGAALMLMVCFLRVGWRRRAQYESRAEEQTSGASRKFFVC